MQDTYTGFACARSTGKTESIKSKGFTHTFKRLGESRLITAPELIHLLPLTDGQLPDQRMGIDMQPVLASHGFDALGRLAPMQPERGFCRP